MDERWDWRDGEAARSAERASAAEAERDAALVRVGRLEAALLSSGAAISDAYDSGLRDALDVLARAIDGYRRLGPAGRGQCHAGDREDALFLAAAEVRLLLRGNIRGGRDM